MDIILVILNKSVISSWFFGFYGRSTSVNDVSD